LLRSVVLPNNGGLRKQGVLKLNVKRQRSALPKNKPSSHDLKRPNAKQKKSDS